MSSIHDNNVYAYVVDCTGKRLILHTDFREREPHEFIDVVFDGVIAHYFEHVLSGNILFSIEEVTVESIVDGYAEMFADSWRFGWPAIEYRGDRPKEAVAQ